MSVTTPEVVPAPVVEVEKTIESAVPAAIQPAVQSVEAEFNTLLNDAVAQAPAAEAQAAVTDPAIEKLAGDVTNVFHGHTINAAEFADVGAAYTEAKAGYKTTEFWGSLLVIATAQIGLLDLPGKYGKTITTGAAAVAYILSRGFAKLGTPAKK